MTAGRTLCDARLRASAAVAVAVVVGLTLGGCYRPNITDGGFTCAASGKPCPDGFTCGADNRCSINPAAPPPPVDSGGMETLPMTDARDALGDAGSEAICMAPAPLCAEGPASGDVCSPACQNGCDCGRCNVVDGATKCVPSGKVQLGDVCTPGAADNCAPGLICLIEACGNGLARCYRHCTSNAQCAGTACTIGIDDASGKMTPYMTCDVPPRACDPLALTGNGCPDPALNCYLNANQTLCDCPTKQGMNNAACTIYSDCAPGFICISGVAGQTSPHCHFVCNTAAPSCPKDGAGQDIPCVPVSSGSKYGYCNG